MIRFDQNKQIWKLRNESFEYLIGLRDGDVYHISFLPIGKVSKINAEEQGKKYMFLPVEAEVNINHEGLLITHGTRQNHCKASIRAKYISHSIKETDDGEELMIVQLDDKSGLEIELHYVLYNNSPALKRFVRVRNTSTKNIDVTQLGSFKLQGFPMMSDNDLAEEVILHTFESSWSWEGNFRSYTMNQLGLHSTDARHAWHVENTSSWSCQEYSPFFVLEEKSANTFWAVQLEHSASWRFELGGSGMDGDNWLYMQGGLGNFVHANWSKKLSPQESFESIPVSMSVSDISKDHVLNQMRKHQNNILIHRAKPDTSYPVIFNEWLTTKGDVREETVLSHIESLENTGVDIYVLDCGWFSNYGTSDGSESWWVTPGDYEPHPVRFPNGLDSIVDKINGKGMIPGIWLEIEVAGELSKAYTELEHLLMKRGEHYVEDNMRRFFYFGNPETRKRATEVFERMINYGFRYFKIDYNVDCAPGCSNSGDSLGQGLVEHVRGYYQWIDELRANHPEIIIENCSSGGMRLEYGMLSHTDLGSITDQEDWKDIGTVAFGLSHIIHPSQMGTWVNGRSHHDEQTINFSLVNAMFGRMHLSGDIESFEPWQMNLYKEGVEFYKSYRHILDAPIVYYHKEEVKHSMYQGWNVLEMVDTHKDITILCSWRYESDIDRENILLHHIDKNKSYSVTSFPSKEKLILKGSQIVENGFKVELNNNYEASVWKFERINE